MQEIKITMNKEPPYKRTKSGLNRSAREAILEVIQSNLKSNKNIRKIQGMDMTLLTSDEFIEQMLNQSNVLVNKVNLHIILKNMINEQLIIRTLSPITTGISSEQIWGRNKAAKKKPGRKRIVHGYTLNFDKLNFNTDAKTLPNCLLYSTHQCNLNKAVLIVKETLNIKENNPRCINRRLFTRLGYIIKHYFCWDFEKFRSWCQWIKRYAKAKLKRLINSSYVWSMFIKQRFERIFAKWSPMWLNYKDKQECDWTQEKMIKHEKYFYNRATGTNECINSKYKTRIVEHNTDSLKHVPMSILKNILNKYFNSVGNVMLEDEITICTTPGKEEKWKIQESYPIMKVQDEYRRRCGLKDNMKELCNG